MKKRLFSLMLVLTLCVGMALPVLADGTGLVRDGADLLTVRAEDQLEAELERISRAYGTDVWVVTLESVGNAHVDEYTNTYFDTHFGRDHNGILLLITMAEREYRILSNGFGADALSSADIDDICDHIEPYLRDGDYAAAFMGFAQDCAYQLEGQVNGFPFAMGESLAVSLLVGFGVGGIVVLVLSLQLRSTGRRRTAQGYTRKGSFRLTGASDIYLYRNVSRRARQDSSSGGGHRSGGGRNMGGGRF